MADHFVYGLVDPMTEEIRYIGQSKEPVRRCQKHCSNPHSEGLLSWIEELQTQDQKPEVVVLEGPLNRKEAYRSEAAWIAKARDSEWPLLNIAPAPANVHTPPESSVKLPRRGGLPIEEVSNLTGYHPEHVRRLVREGRLEAYRIGRMWFVNPDSLDAYVEEMKQFPQSGPRSARQQGGAEEE